MYSYSSREIGALLLIKVDHIIIFSHQWHNIIFSDRRNAMSPLTQELNQASMRSGQSV